MWLFVIAAVAEALTGLAVIVAPVLVGRLLLGAELDLAGAGIARFGGLAFVGFALACWPAGGSGSGAIWPRRALWIFQPAAAICLVLVAVTTGLSGILLWPAVAYHAFATVALARPAIARSRLGKDTLR
jgi:hypothetical protein